MLYQIVDVRDDAREPMAELEINFGDQAKNDIAAEVWLNLASDYIAHHIFLVVEAEGQLCPDCDHEPPYCASHVAILAWHLRHYAARPVRN